MAPSLELIVYENTIKSPIYHYAYFLVFYLGILQI